MWSAWKNCCNSASSCLKEKPPWGSPEGGLLSLFVPSHQGGVTCFVNTPPVEWSLSWLITNIVAELTGYRLNLSVLEGPPLGLVAFTCSVLRFPVEVVPSPLIVAMPEST